MNPGLKYLFCIAMINSCTLSYATDSSLIEAQANKSIQQLYSTQSNSSMAQRIVWFSAQFKGKDYLLGALGEGPNAPYDQFPRYRVDAFDCATYVETVVGLALANSPEGFQKCISLNRYKNGEVSYIQRNHFTGLDWNLNNQDRGWLKDITYTVKDQKNQSVALVATALIDKPSWYAHKTLDTIRLENKDPTEQQKRLDELKVEGSKLTAVSSDVPYVPLSVLFANNKPNHYLFSQIPQGAIIEIIRPNWDLRKQIGTALNVSHLGIAIWNKGILYFREASSEEKKVVDVPLIDYLHNALKSPTIRGINIQIVVPAKPVDECS